MQKLIIFVIAASIIISRMPQANALMTQLYIYDYLDHALIWEYYSGNCGHLWPANINHYEIDKDRLILIEKLGVKQAHIDSAIEFIRPDIERQIEAAKKTENGVHNWCADAAGKLVETGYADMTKTSGH